MSDFRQKYEIIKKCDPPLNGRFIHVKLEGKKQLSLCEIEVYESAGRYNSSNSASSVPHPHIC